MTREFGESSVALRRGHFVNRAESHMRRRKLFADQICQRRYQIIVNRIKV